MARQVVAIIGAGVVGLGIGWQLARRGCSVTILDRGEVARESSWAAAGMLAPLAESVDGGPARDFGLDSLRKYPEFLEDLAKDAGDVPQLEGPGILRLAFDRVQSAALQRSVESFRRAGFPARILSRAELRQREPSITPEAVGALLSEAERHIDPRRLCDALARAVGACGAVIMPHCEVSEIRRGRHMGIVHARGVIECDLVVAAAGAWSAGLLAPFGVHLPIFPRKGQMIALRPPPERCLDHTVYAHHTYLVPRGGRIIVGATEEDSGFDRSLDERAVRHLHIGAAALSPILADAEIIDRWMGFRPATSDGFPILGPLTSEPRIYVASGHRRNGILLAPSTAIRVAGEICGDRDSFFAGFRPQRFESPPSRDRSSRRVVLSIAGSDPSGGAGIQTDQRVIEGSGCAAMTVPTALTSQNSRGVAAVWPVPVAFLCSQLETLLVDTRPDAVKIGLLPSAEHVAAVAEIVRSHKLANVVLDPVIAPTYGQPFLHEDGIRVLRMDLMPLCEMITPNCEETTALTGCDIESVADMRAAARVLVDAGARRVLVKGGHLEHSDGCATDALVGADGESLMFSAPLRDTEHTHGTGCFLSSAIASGLALGRTAESAVSDAKEALTASLARPVIVGQGRGYPGAVVARRSAERSGSHADRIARLRGIYYVTADHTGDDEALLRCVRGALDGGVRNVQLRSKSRSTSALVALARTLREVTRICGALLIINDRVDVALACDADGVHLGPDDMSPADARKLLGDGRLVGISANSHRELDDYGSADAASYIGCGPVFATRTKSDAGAAIGLRRVVEIREIADGRPIVAIGGIDEANLESVRATGPECAAVVGAISGADNPETAARRLREIWAAGRVSAGAGPAG